MNGVRIKDVAAKAGVSTATVSRVLHDNGYVSAAARERVEDALRESGYRINAVARELRKRRTITIGLILHGALSNPFVTEVVVGAEHAAAEQGFSVLLFNARGDAEREYECVETLLSRRVDGIVFTTAVSGDNVQRVVDAGVAAVEIERRLCPAAASVVVDNYDGAQEAMKHLLELGHRRIGYIGEPFPEAQARHEATDIARRRFDAYRDALREAGEPFDEACVVRGDYPREQGGWGGLETGAAYMDRLLAQAPDLTAVFAASDLLAAGALQTLYARGVRVPDRMSLVGFDDTFAPHLAPPLSTVRQPMFEMGFKAASLAITLITDDRAEPPVERCAMSLVVRATTARPGA
ncbi:LacI family DNA-binding transcriptional regulator [Conexibacter stalactiti]|uniref:LacI family DNA-binding transcriptional regulator n=1 Tax=Conexibacter stalactiti TaxID=1940611 RepID=A0ABU4HRR9_9ACTN|nr:LacI family DNA-binding transcriptional regulator [Conexibacter stalactiti]MDW5595439.1 LacI family DNA-binding transcriptional regulator [Conexibacter stalactiti]MEC5036081.1 LacI family DNA-binding transcriptional regulator [Conexibacter stalactiti]